MSKHFFFNRILDIMLLKCLYQARKVSGRVYMCTRGIDFASFYDLSIGIGYKKNLMDSLIYLCLSQLMQILHKKFVKHL